MAISLNVYVGKGENWSTELGLGGSVVKNLSQPLAGNNHYLFMDGFFTSTALFESLLDDGIYACGTIRHTRKGFPEDLKDKKKLNLNRRFIMCACACVYVYI